MSQTVLGMAFCGIVTPEVEASLRSALKVAQTYEATEQTIATNLADATITARKAFNAMAFLTPITKPEIPDPANMGNVVAWDERYNPNPFVGKNGDEILADNWYSANTRVDILTGVNTFTNRHLKL